MSCRESAGWWRRDAAVTTRGDKMGVGRARHRATGDARRVTRGDGGQATAELAVALIGLVIAMVPLLAGVQLVVVGARAQEGAREVARQVARGDDPVAAGARSEAALPGSAATVQRQGRDAVVTVSVPLRLPFGSEVTIVRSARALWEQP